MVRVPVIRRAKREPPRPPEQIRMMVGLPEFNIVAALLDLPVPKLKWGTLMDMATAGRRQIGAGLLFE